jgi:hypothetical protein
MSLTNECKLQYYYKDKTLRDKFKINCEDKNFNDFNNTDNFNNEDFLKFINDKYGPDAFSGGESPFMFNDDYIKETNEQLCNPEEYSLKPQQKFVGQYINPATNFNKSLIYHGLGSGKTCTSIVVGEAFKTTTAPLKMLYVVPAPLVNQYYEEIIGEIIKHEQGQETIRSCTSQCIVIKDSDVGDQYVTTEIINGVKIAKKTYDDILEKYKLKNEELLKTNKKSKNYKKLEKEIFKLQQYSRTLGEQYNKQDALLKNKVDKIFTITTHTKFINNLFSKLKDGSWHKEKYLTDKNSPLLSSNGLLVIDEIQRMISESGILYKKLFTAIYQYCHPELRMIVLTATPIYDNPYELALIMNLLKPRIMFPLTKEKFYSIFLGKYDKDDNCVRSKESNFITQDSCIINEDLLRYMCSGYVSYFKGGNPTAYPYKRIITLEHIMPSFQKTNYVMALKSDVSKDNNLFDKLLGQDEYIVKSKSSEEDDDKVSGIYVITQQFSNIALPIDKTDIIDSLLSNKSKTLINKGLNKFTDDLNSVKTKNPEIVLNFIRQQGYSEKFAKIIELSLECNGPVFIFSNWLNFGVKSLSLILDACGLTRFTKSSRTEQSSSYKYFVWSSETSEDKDLINRARETFNSPQNYDGSKIKIILGTRSIMEGVSFKNVKQVHITDPWWNEARIEQILARAVRFCSHSNLPLEEQYTDIFRHYSVLPVTPDIEISEMLEEVKDNSNFKNFSVLSIEEKMQLSSGKKLEINNEFQNILKQSAYDCNLYQKGNIIRLEELIRPLNDENNYQIYFRDPITLINYIREGIPNKVNLKSVLNRDYSFPNDKSIPLVFYEAQIYDTVTNIFEKRKNDDSYVYKNKSSDPKFEISENLTLYENIKCNEDNNTYEKIISQYSDDDSDILNYLNNITNNYKLLPMIRKQILNEKIIGNRVTFTENKKLKDKLKKCLRSIYNDDKTPNDIKIKLNKILISEKANEIIYSKIDDIVNKYKYLSDEYIPELLTFNNKDIDSLLKEAKEAK